MFGLGFSEIIVVIIAAIIVIGPKDLPKVLRKLGQWSGRLRRMAADLRAQSGIDDVLRSEGLAQDINEIRKLARGELDTVSRAMREPLATVAATTMASGTTHEIWVERERENPREGPDAYGALPDGAIVYTDSLPASVWADDPLYVLGDASAPLPPRAPAMPETATPAESNGLAEATVVADASPHEAPAPATESVARATESA